MITNDEEEGYIRLQYIRITNELMNRGTCKDQMQPTVTHSWWTPAGGVNEKLVMCLMIHPDKKKKLTTYLDSHFLQYQNNPKQYECKIHNAVPVMLKVHNNMYSTHNILIQCPTSKSECHNILVWYLGASGIEITRKIP